MGKILCATSPSYALLSCFAFRLSARTPFPSTPKSIRSPYTGRGRRFTVRRWPLYPKGVRFSYLRAYRSNLSNRASGSSWRLRKLPSLASVSARAIQPCGRKARMSARTGSGWPCCPAVSAFCKPSWRSDGRKKKCWSLTGTWAEVPPDSVQKTWNKGCGITGSALRRSVASACCFTSV